MRLLHDDGFTEREFFTHRNVLQENALTSMQKLIQAATDNVELASFGGIVQEILKAKDLTPKIADGIDKIWKNSSIRQVYESGRRLHLSSATEYYFDHVLRFSAENFIPNEEDLIRARAQTTGITETKFDHNSAHFSIVDVGGQRSERRKWLHCFDNVTCVIYLAALDEYDMILQEDDKTNRLEESLNLFREVSGSHWFRETPFMLFLNKSDLFQKKMKKYPLKISFPEIEEQVAENFEAAVGFIRKKYENNFSGFRLYVFVTCAVDKKKTVCMFLKQCRTLFWHQRCGSSSMDCK